jgi:hypothetical protein
MVLNIVHVGRSYGPDQRDQVFVFLLEIDRLYLGGHDLSADEIKPVFPRSYCTTLRKTIMKQAI